MQILKHDEASEETYSVTSARIANIERDDNEDGSASEYWSIYLEKGDNGETVYMILTTDEIRQVLRAVGDQMG